MTGRNLAQLGALMLALFGAIAAARAERAARGHVHGAGHVALQRYAVARACGVRVGHGYRRYKRLGIRMYRMCDKLVRIRNLDYPAQIHDRNAPGYMLDNQQVVRYEQVCYAQLLLKFFKRIDYLCLNRHVQRRYRLVAHDELGRYGKRAQCLCADADRLKTRAHNGARGHC